MRTIKLKIHNDVYDKLMWFLSKFGANELEIIKEVDEASDNKSPDDIKKVQNQYDEIERNLEQALKKYKSNK